METYFAAYNYRWKTIRIVCISYIDNNYLVNSSSFFVITLQVVIYGFINYSGFIGLFLILWREEYCDIARNVEECETTTIVYGITSLACGIVLYV